MLATTNEQHDCDAHNTLMTLLNRFLPLAPAYRSRGLPLLFLIVTLYPVEAKPTFLPRGQQHERRQSDGSQGLNGLPTQIWVPLLVITLLILVIAVLVRLSRQSQVNQNNTQRQPAANANANQSGTRVVTAAQLAGGSYGRSNGTTDSTGRRQGRRPRRTPSQISTTSLPAYKEQAGDEELVIIRVPQDMEDANMPLDTIRGPDEEDIPTHVRTSSHYSDYPQNSNVDSLLQNDESTADISSDRLQLPSSPIRGMTRRSVETLQDSLDSGSLMRATSAPDSVNPPINEAPPYYEVVGSTLGSSRVQHVSMNARATTSSSPPPAAGPPSPVSPVDPSRRQSAFRNLFGGGRPNPSHTRGPSNTSVDTTHTRDSSHPRRTHRPQSSSGSVLSLTPFKSLARQKSSGTLNSNILNSPSTISLNSISAPLSHTLVRTEFTYPKAGLTPEQVKLISSRDSLMRFGVPYGADAVAYASASRLDLQQPPPAFEGTGASGSSSRPRANSSAVSEGSRQSLDAPTALTNGHSSTDTPGPSSAHPPPTRQSPPSPSSSSPIQTPEDVLEPLPSPPPSAFKSQAKAASPTLRSESRIGSHSSQSFATAADAVPSPRNEEFEISIRPSSPLTGSHASEATDMTITPARANT